MHKLKIDRPWCNYSSKSSNQWADYRGNHPLKLGTWLIMELVRPKGYFLLQTRDEYNHNHNHNTNHNTDQKHKLVHFTEELDKLMA
jgi:hypothetical protein